MKKSALIKRLLVVCLVLASAGLVATSFLGSKLPASSSSSKSFISKSVKKPMVASAHRFWIINSNALSELLSYPSSKTALANDTIYVTVKKGLSSALQNSGLNLIPTESFTSETQLASAVNSGDINPQIKALLYDNEDWSLTPASEQTNLVSAYIQAAAVAHAHGYILIGTPVSKKYPDASVLIAPYADVVDIQSQYDQTPTSAYSSHVLPLANKARLANTHLIILSGLSTNPPAGIPTAQQLLSDADSVSGSVQGFWLNIPSPSTTCPRCNQPQPAIGADFVRMLSSND